MSTAPHDLPRHAGHRPNDPGHRPNDAIPAPAGGTDAPDPASPDDGSLIAPSAQSSAIFGFLGGFAGLLGGVAISLLPVTGLSFSGRAVLFGGIGLLAGAATGFALGSSRDDESASSPPIS